MMVNLQKKNTSDIKNSVNEDTRDKRLVKTGSKQGRPTARWIIDPHSSRLSCRWIADEIEKFNT
jgi:hypothetical protein